jgi:hypothetical protein
MMALIFMVTTYVGRVGILAVAEVLAEPSVRPAGAPRILP